MGFPIINQGGISVTVSEASGIGHIGTVVGVGLRNRRQFYLEENLAFTQWEKVNLMMKKWLNTP